MPTKSRFYLEDNRDGWHLGLRQRWDPEALDSSRRPLAIIPGYGMNSFIFGWHPDGESMAEYLVRRGFEVWTVDLRSQGCSVRRGGSLRYRLEDIALRDFDAAFEAIVRHTNTETDRLDGIGCSLGGTYLYIHAAMRPEHRLGAIVGMGAPLRWDEANPFARLLLWSPRVVSKVPIRGTRRLARFALPLALRFPWILHAYMHPEMINTSDLDQLVQTVEDPNPRLNEDMALWLRRRDIVIDGTRISEALRRVKLPFLCMYGNGDGIVPKAAAVSAYHCIGTPEAKKSLFQVGNDQYKFAHADMFISRHARAMVFEPLADWLEGLYGP